MPTYVLANNLAASLTGSAFYVGRSKPPYTIKTSGGYTVAGVTIQTSIKGEYVNGSGPSGTTFSTAMGWVAGPGMDPADQPAPLTIIVDGSTVVIDYPVKFIQVVTEAITGTATVHLYTDC